MENRWKGSERDTQVFYKDMRFWLIVCMMIAFFVFTLIRYP